MYLLPWTLLGATQAWLHAATANQPQWLPVLAEAAAFLWVGFSLYQLGRAERKWLAHPVWAIALPVFFVALREAPAGVSGLLYCGGAVTLVLGPALWLSVRVRVRVPVLLVAAIVPFLVAALHTVTALGPDWTDPERLADRTRRELAGPLVQTRAASTAQGRSVVWLTVDTLRADDAQQMETWSRLAARGAWWPSAQATSSWTLPSLASLHTGTLSSTHGAGCLPVGFCQGLDPLIPTLASTLRDAGYATVGISANPWAGRQNGLEAGFQQFYDLGIDRRRPLILTSEILLGPHPQSAEAAVERAIAEHARLEQSGGAYFLWVHVIDPHLPYTQTESPLAGLGAETLRNANIIAPELREELREAYRREIAYTDRHLLRLLDAIGEEPIVVFTSDHGEEFWEHGGIEHGHSHHKEVVEVPLVVVGPNMRTGRHEGLASLIDVAPTVLGMLDQPAQHLPGLDLRAPIPDDRIVTAEGSLHHRPLCSAISQSWRLIRHDCEGPTERLDAYERATDRGEHRPTDIAPGHPMRSAATAVMLPTPRSATNQDTEALRALGYVE